MKLPLILIIMSLASSMAIADDVTKSDCKQPVVPNRQASDIVLKSFEKKSKNYNDCITKFVATQRQIEKTATDQITASQAHSAAESAIVEFNKYSEELKARNDRVPGAGEEE